MLTLRIIILCIITCFYSVSYCELPTPNNFITLCNFKNKYFAANELKTILDNATSEDRTFWLSSFTEKYSSPLIYAVLINHLPLVETIIQYMVVERIAYYEFSIANGKTLLVFATMAENARLVDILLRYNHPIAIGYGLNQTSPLHEAAKLGNISLLNRLINDKSSFLLHVEDNSKYTPINYLIKKKSSEIFIVSLLQKYSFDLNHIPLDAKGNNYLYGAVINRLPYVVEILLELGLEPEQRLVDLAENKNDFVIKKLIKYKLLTRSKKDDSMFNCFCAKKKNYNDTMKDALTRSRP